MRHRSDTAMYYFECFIVVDVSAFNIVGKVHGLTGIPTATGNASYDRDVYILVYGCKHNNTRSPGCKRITHVRITACIYADYCVVTVVT